MSDSRTKATAVGFRALVSAATLVRSRASAMGRMSPSRAWAARARMAARAGSGGASRGPKRARLATRPGSDAARCAAMIVPIECATTCTRSIPVLCITRRAFSTNSVSERGASTRWERPDPGRSNRMVRWRANAPSTGVKVLEVPPRPWIINTGSPSPSISTAMRSTNTATSSSSWLPRCGMG